MTIFLMLLCIAGIVWAGIFYWDSHDTPMGMFYLLIIAVNSLFLGFHVRAFSSQQYEARIESKYDEVVEVTANAGSYLYYVDAEGRTHSAVKLPDDELLFKDETAPEGAVTD